MTRRIPVFSFDEELNSKKPQVYKSLVDGVSEAIKFFADIKKLSVVEFNKIFIVKEIKLCEVKNSGVFITVEKQEWKKSLDSALQFYIDSEEYEECSKIKNLIDKL